MLKMEVFMSHVGLEMEGLPCFPTEGMEDMIQSMDGFPAVRTQFLDEPDLTIR